MLLSKGSTQELFPHTNHMFRCVKLSSVYTDASINENREIGQTFILTMAYIYVRDVSI